MVAVIGVFVLLKAIRNRSCRVPPDDATDGCLLFRKRLRTKPSNLQRTIELRAAIEDPL